MPITRSQVETVLLSRARYLMKASHLDYESEDGANPDLNDAIGYAARACDLTVANLTKVSDTDLAGLDTDDIDKLLDLAEFRLLQTILGNYDKFGLKVGPRSEYQSQLAERLELRVARLEKKLELQYGIWAATLEAGYVSRNFAEHNEAIATE